MWEEGGGRIGRVGGKGGGGRGGMGRWWKGCVGEGGWDGEGVEWVGGGGEQMLSVKGGLSFTDVVCCSSVQVIWFGAEGAGGGGGTEQALLDKNEKKGNKVFIRKADYCI